MAIGAANFSGKVPIRRKDGSFQSPLAAFNVAAEHLEKASFRQAETHDPVGEFAVTTKEGKQEVLSVARLYIAKNRSLRHRKP